MIKFKKVFSILLAGCISISNLGLECQAFDYTSFQDEKPQQGMSIYNIAEIYHKYEERFWEILVNREGVKFISKEMGREKFYIDYLNEIVESLELTLLEQDVIYTTWDIKYMEIYNEMLQRQQDELSRIDYNLGTMIYELKKKNPIKFCAALKKFDENYYEPWTKQWTGVERY